MNKDNAILKTIIGIALMWLALTVSVYIHEWTHGLLAWIYGYKSSPFAISYGGFSWQNLLYWANIDQAVNSYMIALIGHPYQSGIILIVPPIIINGGFALLSGWWLYRSVGMQGNNYLAWFVFWLYLWNVSEFYSYTVLRSFSTHADIGLFLTFFKLSPWYIFIPGAYLSLLAIHLGLKIFMPYLFETCDYNAGWKKVSIFIAAVLALLPFTALRAITPNYNPIVHMLCYYTIIFTPVIIIFYWPRLADGRK